MNQQRIQRSRSEGNEKFFWRKQFLPPQVLPVFLNLILLSAFSLWAGNDGTVKVSQFSPQKEDATAAVQAALDSGAAKVIFDKLPFDYIVKPIMLRGNQEVIISDGVKVRAMPDQFHGPTDTMFIATDIKNLIIQGEGSAELTMNKADYQDPSRYSRSEWRNTIAVLGCENVTIRGLKVSQSGGDGIYVSGSEKINFSKNVTLENLVSTEHHRQGCSIISAEDLLVRNCKFINTKGTPPQAGIDFEPNNSKQVLVNCLVENCEFIGNAGSGGGCGLHYALAKPVSITFKNCRFTDNRYAAFEIWPGGDRDKPITGTISLIGCHLDNMLVINNQRNHGAQIILRDVMIENKGDAAPIMLHTQFNDNISNIDFGNTTILQDLKKPVFKVGALGAAGISPLKGSIIVKANNGSSKKFDLEQLSKQYSGNVSMRDFVSETLDVRDMVPGSSSGIGENPLNLRGKVRFLQYGKAGEPIELVFTVVYLPKGQSIKIPVTVTDAYNTFVEKFEIKNKEFIYRFVPKYNSVFSFSFSTANTVNIKSTAPGQGYDTSKRLSMMGCNGEFYFQVPKDIENVRIELWGDMGEAVAGELYDQSGRLVAKVPHNYGIQFLTAKRHPSTKPELWKLKIKNAREDHGIRLGAPLNPIVFTDPANILVKKE